MYKKFIALMLAIALILSSVAYVFADDETAFDTSLARVEAAIEYMNAEYLNSDLGNEFEYGTLRDKEQLQALADYITIGCNTDTDKANAIYDWMLNNVDYDYNSFTAIDVFRTLGGICSGHAQLFTTLCRLSGIECAVIRGYKADTTYVNMEFIYTKGYRYSHEWSMAYCDGQWLLYDDLWGYRAISDTEVMAHWYFLCHVDGIVPSVDILDVNVDTTVTETYYDNGKFVGYKNGTPVTTTCAIATLQVGGCLHYIKNYYRLGFNSYYSPSVSNVNYGDALPAGYYVRSNTYPLRVKENGISYRHTTLIYDDNYYLTDGNNSVLINEAIDAHGLINGEIAMYVGQKIDLSDMGVNAAMSVNSDNDSITLDENGVLTAVNTGSGKIRLQFKYTISYFNVYVYGDINESNELFQYLCSHEYTHTVDDNEYCDYCGKLIVEPIEEEIEEVEEVTEGAIEVPEVITEPAIEQPEEVQVVEEEIIDEVVEPEVIEEPEIVPEVTEEPVEPEVVESTEPEELDEGPVEEVTEPAIEAPEVIEEVTEEAIELPTSEVVTTSEPAVQPVTTPHVTYNKVIKEVANKVKQEYNELNFENADFVNVFNRRSVTNNKNAKYTIYIAIRGDNKFSIVNNKDVLEIFLKNANKIFNKNTNRYLVVYQFGLQ